MSHLRQWQVGSIWTALLSAVLIACFFPADASNLTTELDRVDAPRSESLEVATFVPHGPDHAVPPDRDIASRRLTQQLTEAKHLLERLRVFAETAKRAIETGRRLETLRSERVDLREALTTASIDHRHLQDAVADAETKGHQLSKTVINKWLIFFELRQREASVDEKLAKARADWAGTTIRLDRLLKEREQQRQKTRNLRAESATLAAEIGRMKRQIANVKRETLVIEGHRLDIQTATRQLRHDVSARLRNILTVQ